MSGPFFTVDGDALVPGPMAQGPWGNTLGGHIVGGLLGWAVEREGGDPALQPARLTVDLLRPALMEPVSVRSSICRQGKRIRVMDAEVRQHGEVVARASSVFLRRGEHPDGGVWQRPVSMPPLPDSAEVPAQELPFALWAYGINAESGTLGGIATEWQQDRSPRFAWMRVLRPLIAGHPITPFVRVALVADVTSSMAHWSTGGLRYINAEFTVTLCRLPEGEFVGLAADGHHGADGVAVGSATVFDQHGPIGNSTAVALAQPAEAFRPTLDLGAP